MIKNVEQFGDYKLFWFPQNIAREEFMKRFELVKDPHIKSLIIVDLENKHLTISERVDAALTLSGHDGEYARNRLIKKFGRHLTVEQVLQLEGVAF